jgi:hypothetical protein
MAPQSFGLFDIDLADISPDFYSGSSTQVGVRRPRIRRAVHQRARAEQHLAGRSYSAYPGAVGISKTFEKFRAAG